MSDSNLSVGSNKKEKKAKEEKIVKNIRPKLEKFLIDRQVNQAADIAHQQYQKDKETLEEMTKSQADVQASKIAMHAFLDLKLWEKFPAPLEYAWLTGVRMSDGKRLTMPEIQTELATDISGFSHYLVQEWQNMKLKIKEGKYPDPMDQKEETIVFFWQKFVADLAILIKTEARYKALGNKGLLLND